MPKHSLNAPPNVLADINEIFIPFFSYPDEIFVVSGNSYFNLATCAMKKPPIPRAKILSWTWKLNLTLGD